MYQTLLGDSNFFRLLLRCDEDLATRARAGGCGCGGVVHSAQFPRKPRGGPADLGPEHAKRFSFCCAREGCRRRVTPPSLRFLGRKVFFGVVVLLAPILMEGPTPGRVRRLQDRFSVSERTLRRWRRWWRESVAHSRFFAAARGGFTRPVAGDALPVSLLEAFATLAEPVERVLAMLRWLAPSSLGSVNDEHDPCGSSATRRRCVSTVP